MKAYDTKCYRSVDIGKGIAGGQDMLSPYQAMGSNPANYVDPDGLKIKINGDIHDPLLTSFLNDWLGGGNYGFDNDNNLFIIPGHEQEAIGSLANYFMTFMGSGGGCEAANTAANAYAGIVMAMINGDNFNGSIVPGQEMDGHIYSGENGVFQIGPNARLANVAINGEKIGPGFLSWDGPIARYFVPDKISLSMGGDISAFLGVGVQAVNFTLLTRGKDPGLYLTPTINVNAGYGTSVSGSFNFTTGNYTGDPRNISGNMLEGNTYGVMATGGYIGDISIGASYSPTGDGHGFINESVGIGAGFGFFVGGQYQYTPGAGKLWGW